MKKRLDQIYDYASTFPILSPLKNGRMTSFDHCRESAMNTIPLNVIFVFLFYFGVLQPNWAFFFTMKQFFWGLFSVTPVVTQYISLKLSPPRTHTFCLALRSVITCLNDCRKRLSQLRFIVMLYILFDKDKIYQIGHLYNIWQFYHDFYRLKLSYLCCILGIIIKK